MIKLSNIVKVSLVGLVGILAVSCGSSTNNDQGTSFLAFGYYADAAGSTGSSGTVAPLYTDVPVGNIDGLQTQTFMGLQNRLTRQFIRVVRFDCDYSVSGSFINIPSESFATSTVIGPTVATTTGGTTGGATGGTTGGTTGGAAGGGAVASRQYIGFQILSPDIYSFINNNKASFPELPFRMTAICSATGITQSGDVLTTNPLNYFIQFVENSECCTDGNGNGRPDFQVGTGTGGNLATTGTNPPQTSN